MRCGTPPVGPSRTASGSASETERFGITRVLGGKSYYIIVMHNNNFSSFFSQNDARISNVRRD